MKKGQLKIRYSREIEDFKFVSNKIEYIEFIFNAGDKGIKVTDLGDKLKKNPDQVSTELKQINNHINRRKEGIKTYITLNTKGIKLYYLFKGYSESDLETPNKVSIDKLSHYIDKFKAIKRSNIKHSVLILMFELINKEKAINKFAFNDEKILKDFINYFLDNISKYEPNIKQQFLMILDRLYESEYFDIKNLDKLSDYSSTLDPTTSISELKHIFSIILFSLKNEPNNPKCYNYLISILNDFKDLEQDFAELLINHSWNIITNGLTTKTINNLLNYFDNNTDKFDEKEQWLIDQFEKYLLLKGGE